MAHVVKPPALLPPEGPTPSVFLAGSIEMGAAEDWQAQSPMPADAAFDQLMARLRAGDPDAAAAVFDRFAKRLIGLARSRLDGRLRRKVDPDDVVQSIYKSFFLHHAQGRVNPDNWESPWSLQTIFTMPRCGRWKGHFLARIRDVNAEVTPAPVTRRRPGTLWQTTRRRRGWPCLPKRSKAFCAGRKCAGPGHRVAELAEHQGGGRQRRAGPAATVRFSGADAGEEATQANARGGCQNARIFGH
jgi:hypothetical protein